MQEDEEEEGHKDEHRGARPVAASRGGGGAR